MSCARQDIVPQKPEQNVSSAPVFCAIAPSESDAEGEATKTYIDAGLSIYWSAGDELSIFRSATNEEYVYKGLSGQVESEFEKKDSSVPGTLFSRNYALYPYCSEATAVSEGEFTVVLPSMQHYAENSFGEGANLMAAVTEDTEDKVLRFKNVCGYVKLQLYGGETVRQIAFHGNSGERMAGAATVMTEYDKAPAITMSASAAGEIVLDCGEDGIKLGDNEEGCTPFWIVVPPTDFKKGFTIDVTTVDGKVSTFATASHITVERNKIARMAARKVEFQNSTDILSFSLSNGTGTYDAFDISNGYVNVQVPNGTDMTDMIANFVTNGGNVTVDGTEQTSGVSRQNFDDFTSPVKYVVTAADGVSRQEYTVRMFDLPVVIVNTDDSKPITDKVNYKGCTIKILDYGKETVLDESAQIKGRGNATWGAAKKPYNIKFSSKQKVLDMPKHKKWCLLANYGDRTLMRNAICLEIANLADGMSWNPHGRFVEIIVNGEPRGNYWLCEKIEVDEIRLDIDKENGWLVEHDVYEDDDYWFKSQLFKERYKIKAPVEEAAEDPDSLKLKEMKQYFYEIEDILSGKVDGNYQDYIDMASFIDYLLVNNFVYNLDAGHNSTYVYRYSGDSKLYAGPAWDFDNFSFNKVEDYACIKQFFYPYLLKDNVFKYNVKQRWSKLRDILGTDYMPDRIESTYNEIRRSALRDEVIWPVASRPKWNPDMALSFMEAKNSMLIIYHGRLSTIDNWVNSLSVNYDEYSGQNEDFSDQQDDSDGFNFGN